MYSYQMGGGMPPEQQEIITAVAQAVKQGVNPNEILKRLKKMGMSEEDAYNLIRSVAQTVQQTDQESQQMDENPGMAETMKAGGTFSGNLFYQTGGGYIPEYGNMAYGGYHSEIPRLFNQPVDRPNKAMYGAFSMAKGGAFDNPGFKALPEFVQQKIMAASGKAMYGMGMMAHGGNYIPKAQVGFNNRNTMYEPVWSSSNLDSIMNAPNVYYNISGKRHSNPDGGFKETAQNLSQMSAEQAQQMLQKMAQDQEMKKLNRSNSVFGVDEKTGRIILNQKSGGQMPQWLAERRFAAAGNMDKMADYGYAEGGQYNIGDEIDVTPQELEMLKQQGYKFEILD